MRARRSATLGWAEEAHAREDADILAQPRYADDFIQFPMRNCNPDFEAD
jgi:hypothetical protein